MGFPPVGTLFPAKIATASSLDKASIVKPNDDATASFNLTSLGARTGLRASSE